MLSTLDQLKPFARSYTAAWCSQNASSVADHYAPQGSLTINNRTPSIGRASITAAAQDFMTAFPDLTVFMDDVLQEGDHAIYKWTLEGTNTGSGGTGKKVRISGFEKWKIGADNLIAESQGHFDQAEYDRQLEQ
jgi:predicted ester cyclase